MRYRASRAPGREAAARLRYGSGLSSWNQLIGRLLPAVLCARLAVPAIADPPSLEALFPPGAVPGKTYALTLVGKFEKWPVGIWMDGAGVTLEVGTNRGACRITVASNAPPGPRLVRVFDDQGASEPRIFVVSDGPDILELEPNDRFTAPQAIPELPMTVEGRLDRNGDVDCFSVSLKAGQRLEAAVDAYMLESPVDAVLRFVSSDGIELAWNHDGASLDPNLSWQTPVEQSVVVQVFGFKYPADASIRLTGGEADVYRLRLRTTPGIALREPVLSPSDSVPAEERAGRTGKGSTASLVVAGAQGTGTAHFTRDERGPSDGGGAGADVLPFRIPMEAEGVLRSDREVDRFWFSASKGEMLEARVETASLDSPLDAWIRIENADGRELAFNDDDHGSTDPRLEWTAATNDAFVVAIGSTVHRGGPEFRYRFTLHPIRPDFDAFLSAGSVAVSTGKTNDVKLSLERFRGFSHALTADFRDLPEGVSTVPTSLPSGSGEASVALWAATNAPAFHGPVRVVIADGVEGVERTVPFRMTSQGQNNGVPNGYARLLRGQTDRIWLTVRPAGVAAPVVAGSP